MIIEIGLDVGAHVVLLGRLVEPGHQLHRVIEHGHHMREGIAEESGDPDCDVDAGTFQFGQWNYLKVDHPTRGLIPDRPCSEQRQHFSDVIAGVAHRGGAPHRQSDRPRPLAVIGPVALE